MSGAAHGEDHHLGFDTTVAHNARVWNYWLDGKDHFEADRVVGDQVASMFPLIADVARADRAFLGRVVHHLAGEAGIRQFLDIGTGLPTAENTHQVAQRLAPQARVVYVDNDPLVLVHARALLTSARPGTVNYVDADAHDPEAILRAASSTLDFTRPVAIMLLGIMNFVLDTAQARSIVQRLLRAVPSGSYLALTHPTLELGGDGNAEAMRFWNENAKPPITARTRAELATFLDSLELLEPGLVSCTQWRQESGDVHVPVLPQYGALARKP
jgi:O-methyltransferase involved in polyketide biosynthesis